MKNIHEIWEFIEWLAKVKIKFTPYYVSEESKLLILNQFFDAKIFWDPFCQSSISNNSSDDHFDGYTLYCSTPLMYNYIDKNWLILSKFNFVSASNFHNTEADVLLFWKHFRINNKWVLSPSKIEEWYNEEIVWININNCSDNYLYDDYLYENYMNKEWKVLNEKWWNNIYYNDSYESTKYNIIKFKNWKYNIVSHQTWLIYDINEYDQASYISWWDKIKLKYNTWEVIVVNSKWKEVVWIFKYF